MIRSSAWVMEAEPVAVGLGLDTALAGEGVHPEERPPTAPRDFLILQIEEPL